MDYLAQLSSEIFSLSRRIGDIERKIANIVSYGTIEEADYEAARVKVRVGKDSVTRFLPWLTHRASNDTSWHAPEVGEQVVIFSPDGDLSIGVVMPSIYQDEHPPVSNNVDVEKTVYKDGSYDEYNRADHVRTIRVVGGDAHIIVDKLAHVKGENILLEASNNIEIKAGNDVSTEAGSNISEDAGNNISESAGKTIDSKAGKTISSNAGKTVKIKGGNAVGINGGSNIQLTAPKTGMNTVLSAGKGGMGGKATFEHDMEIKKGLVTKKDTVAGGVSVIGHHHSCKDGGTGAPS